MRVSLQRDFWRVLTAALVALTVAYALRLWVMGSGLGLESFADIWMLRSVPLSAAQRPVNEGPRPTKAQFPEV